MVGTLTISGSVGNSAVWINDGYWPTTTNGSNWVAWQGDTIFPPNDGWKSEYNQKGEVKDMRGLFHIVVVEYKTDKILQDGLVIAKDRETAKIKALAPFADAHDLDDLDAVCNKLGDVRKKREVQKVTIVEGGE